MTHRIALLFAAVAIPGMAAAQDFAGGPRDFQLYRGSEFSLDYGQVRDGTSIVADGLTADTRHLFQIAPFLGAQVEAGLRWIDLDDWAFELGGHLYAIAEDGSRFGVFYLPTFFEDDALFDDDRADNYGIEGMFSPLPPLTIEARLGRFDGAYEGGYGGIAGYYALSPELAVTGSIEHNRLDFGFDLNTTDVLVGAEYYIPTANARVFGGVGFIAEDFEGDNQTDLRLQLGVTLFAFGDAATTARMRSFDRQRVPTAGAF